MSQRLQKILSQWGVASRRHAERMILAGRIKVNGQTAQLGQNADPQVDRIEVDNCIIQPQGRPQLLYILLNKPLSTVTTCNDQRGRTTVLDLLPTELTHSQGLHPVGRLDAESTGALLLTNDGELTFGLTHPRHCIPKTYEVWVKGHPPESVLQLWREGVMLLGRKTLPASVKIIKEEDSQTLLQVILKEGRNRQIRRIAKQLGYPVIALHRTAIGSLNLKSDERSLASGKYRFLEPQEVQILQENIQQIFLDVEKI
ncbi:pseudouridine synthase [Merismopedia glauca]|uniref:Pseudouridine synthase n=1 Tax=Merismopedia glauca CCAP 1448/3 TaxID=1296344 RepID=A0A2T1C3I2_9CYAN|nr:pseudouridine synthase [Merismopedia glauca]PSB02822.1 pseudouridine synthase [Merismopedia glauca CCAP 1448/3]